MDSETYEDEEIDSPNIRRKRKDARIFVEGDELVHMLEEIASELYDRGEDELGSEASSMLAAVLGDM